MTKDLRRLSEKDWAALYTHAQAPIKLDTLLQSVNPDTTTLQIDVHDVIGTQTPDMALISLSLCGLLIVRDFPEDLKDGFCGPVLRELVWDAEDNLLSVGRLWIDINFNDIKPDPKTDKETLLSIPERLRILTSIFMELKDALDPSNRAHALIHQALNVLYYQAESQADLGDAYISQLSNLKKKDSMKKSIPDHVPLPFDLERPKDGAQIVSFSLFHKKR